MIIVAPTIIIGSSVLIMPRDKPLIIIVAEPVSDAAASFCVGLYVSDV